MEMDAGWYHDPVASDRERYWDGTSWTDQIRLPSVFSDTSVAPDSALAPASASGDSAPRRPRGRVLVSTLAVVVLAAAGVGAYVVVSGRNTAASASQQVASAATDSISQNSVDMTMAMTVSGLSLPALSSGVSGTGQFDFVNHEGSITLQLPSVTSQSAQLIFDGQTVYASIGSLVSDLFPGKTWVSAPASQFSSQASDLGSAITDFGSLLGDPSQMLKELESEGGTVTSLGATTYEGTAVTEYQVIPSSGSIANGLSLLPSSLKLGALGMGVKITEDVYVGTDGLLRAIEVPISMALLGKSFTATMQMGFTNYGAPVSITPPPASEVVPMSQFRAADLSTNSTAA
jgi:hypothetical protein